MLMDAWQRENYEKAMKQSNVADKSKTIVSDNANTKIVLEIPNVLFEEYAKDKFKETFERVLADINTKGLVSGRFEKETMEMLLKCFQKSEIYT